MITNIKYVGVGTDDLIDIYKLYIRSIMEYCSVVWHSTLTEQQSMDLERVQKLWLKVILGDRYTSYEGALEVCELESLTKRRESRCLKFVHSKLFPVSPPILTNTSSQNREHFQVNWARTESYRISAVPHIKRKLNEYVKKRRK